MTGLRRLKSPAPATPLEDDNLLSEILLRLPPLPSSLPRASLVCNRWLGLVSDDGFLRRFRSHHHRNPPLLGLMFDDVSRISFIPTLESPNRIPSGRFSFQFDDGDQCCIMGCRHGLVLVFNSTRLQVQVWDPVTGDHHRLAVPRELDNKANMLIMNGAVVRAAGSVHTGHNSSSFKVVLVGQYAQYTRAFACVYSSETGLWGNLISTSLPSEDIPVIPMSIPSLISMTTPSVLVGNSLYWNLINLRGILEFDLHRECLSAVPMPVYTYADHRASCWVMPAEGGGLGLFFLSAFTARLLKRKIGSDGVAAWELGRTIELNKLLSMDSESSLSILGFTEHSNVVFVGTPIGLFMLQLDSLQFRKLLETQFLCVHHPFASIYTAETGIGTERDGDELISVPPRITDN